MTPLDLREEARRAVEWVRARGGAAAEVYLYRGESRSFELRDGRPHTRQQSAELGMGLRLFEGGRMGFASAGGLGPDVLPRLYDLAASQLRHLPADEARALPVPSKEAPGAPAALEDPSIMEGPLSAQEPRLRELQERVLGADKRIRKVLEAAYGEGRCEVAVASSAGLLSSERSTHCGVALEALAEQDGETQVGSGSRSARRVDALDFGRAAEEAAQRTTALLGSRRVPTRRRAVLFDPWAAGELLDLLAGALSADAVQRGKSLFKGRLGQSVASPLVSLVDDPLMDGGLSSSRYDDEGLPTRRKEMIRAGELREFFYDSYTARKDARASNGCASRSGYKGLPSPGPSNFHLAPGSSKRADLIAGTRDGLLVLELLGMHTADPISGEFSVGVGGIAVEDGKLTHGVKGAMLSGSLLDLLGRVDAVADDLVFYGSLAAPTFRVADLMVAG